MADLQAIRERLAKATPGPWEADGSEIKAALYGEFGGKWIGETLRTDDPRSDADAAFIAHAPTDVASLLAEVDRLRNLVDALAFPAEDDDAVSLCLHWRAVTAEGGSPFSQAEGDYGEFPYKARENVEAWIAEHPDYGGGMHLECWEQRWTSTPAVWTQLAVEGTPAGEA